MYDFRVRDIHIRPVYNVGEKSGIKITKRFKLSDIEQYLIDRARGWHYVNDTLVPVKDAMVIPPLVMYLKQKAGDLDKRQGAETL
jgi:hypothetical protein